MTSSFIILTLPTTVAGGYFLIDCLSSEGGKTVLFVCDSLAFSYHALNFFVLLIVNKQFTRELRKHVRYVLKRRIVTFS